MEYFKNNKYQESFWDRKTEVQVAKPLIQKTIKQFEHTTGSYLPNPLNDSGWTNLLEILSFQNLPTTLQIEVID